MPAASLFFNLGLRSVLDCDNPSAHIMEPLLTGDLVGWKERVALPNPMSCRVCWQLKVAGWRLDGSTPCNSSTKQCWNCSFHTFFSLQNPSRQLTQQLGFDSALKEPGFLFRFFFPRFFLAGGLSCFSAFVMLFVYRMCNGCFLSNRKNCSLGARVDWLGPLGVVRRPG